MVSTPLKLIIAGGVVNRFGSGLVLPFTIIYLHDQRDIPLSVAGLLLGLFGAAGLAITPVAGNAIDRIGATRTLAGALGMLAVGYAGLAFVTGPVTASLALVAAGFGNGVFWPAHKALLAILTPPGQRHVAFTLDQMGGNIGLGLGSLAGGLVVGVSSAASPYSLLFVLNAASYLLFILLLPWRAETVARSATPRPATPRPATPEGDGGTADAAEGPAGTAAAAGAAGAGPDGWRTILRHAAVRRLLGVQLFVVTFGVVGMEQMLTVYIEGFGGVPASLLGLVFAANVVAYLLVQMPIRRLLENRATAGSLSWGIYLWGLVWLPLVVAANLVSGVPVLIVACLVAALVAVGESVVTVTVDPTVSDIAPPHLLGRFLSALTLTWNIGLIAGPVIGGLLLDLQPNLLWPVFAGVLVAAGAQARRLNQDLPRSRQIIQPSQGVG